MLNLVANGPSGYTINNSLRFRSSASAYLNRTPGSAGNRTVWTWSGWVKLGVFANNPFFAADVSGTAYEYFRVNGSGNIQWGIYSSGTIGSFTTNAVYRDPSAWYHVVITRNGTTSACYVNGVSQSFSANTTTSSNGYINATNRHTLGANIQDAQYYDGYMAEVNFIDGQALTPSSFGSTNAITGVWQPAKYTGTYGTNGFYLNFNSIALTSGSNTGLGKDNSGNGNYWNTNNISVTAGTTYDAMTDVPTLTSATVANYATLNPINKASTSTISNANLGANSNGAAWNGVVATMAIPSTGKYYWEVTASGANTNPGIISIDTNFSTALATYPANGFYSYNYIGSDGTKISYGNVHTAYGATFGNGDIIGIAYDADSGSITFYKNNTSQGVAFTGITGQYMPYFGVYDSGVQAINFGQRPFSYTPPTGYVALNTYNLPSSTIPQGNKYMDATLYTGNLTGQSITNSAAFKPDLVWIKSRSAATDNKLTDSVRGATIALISNSTAAETTDTTGMTAFNTNGFTVGASTVYNNTSATYVGWQWQAGQGSSSSNTNGSITSTVSVNASAGFSVATYTAQASSTGTVGHGLGIAPSMIICKTRGSPPNSWYVYHSSLGNTKYLLLDGTSAAGTSSSLWNNTSPTSSVFTLGTGFAGLGTMVSYCWAEIAGFSKFTSYTGNGSTDGPFIYCGFQPKFILIKAYVSSVGQSWSLHDTTRSPYNVTILRLQAESSNAESSNVSNSIDVLSNGFKIRTTDNEYNNASYSYIVAAFASNPFKNSNAF